MRLLNISEASNAGHLTLYLAALSMFLSHPLLGVGLGNFAVLVPYYTNSFFYAHIISTDTHNFILQIMAELGFIGLFSIVIFLAIVLKYLKFKHSNKSLTLLSFSKGFAFAFIAASLMALTMNGFQT